MSRYKLIALDMDGTVVNDRKEIEPETREAIHQALALGKQVVFCTGRSFVEMEDDLSGFPDMQYLCGESGALVYDIKGKKALSTESMNNQEILKIEKILKDRDVMLQIMSDGRNIATRNGLPNMADYGMAGFQKSFDKCAIPVDNMFDYIRATGCGVEKFNIFHRNVSEREITKKQMDSLGLDMTYVDAEISSIECSAKGVDKGRGLKNLCEVLNISLDEVIMVGDSGNDQAALEVVGLPIAMGNAWDSIKAICKVVVKDNNHNGVAQAIREYFI